MCSRFGQTSTITVYAPTATVIAGACPTSRTKTFVLQAYSTDPAFVYNGQYPDNTLDSGSYGYFAVFAISARTPFTLGQQSLVTGRSLLSCTDDLGGNTLYYCNPTASTSASAIYFYAAGSGPTQSGCQAITLRGYLSVIGMSVVGGIYMMGHIADILGPKLHRTRDSTDLLLA